ncbi:phospholipase [Bradyrhizobium centrolobii]|uniref:Phospholipase D n=1 Tax=Bradyrhizobium centrolobii TaxID=1505087 RepID=A0A176YSR8_9BRAD|nr:phospholipase [Bradyrhizobium centrolobii]
MTAPASSNPPPAAPSGFEVVGTNANALFTLKLHRGDGMTLLAMNWKHGQPPQDFVGFAIEYQEPGGTQFFALKNRLGFLDASGNVNPATLSTLESPIQKFRWVHFPRNAELAGDFIYRVTPMFMDANDKLSKGEPQQAPIQLARETYPGIANVTFTRGFVSSQAFVDRYLVHGPIETLVAPVAAGGLNFTPTHPDTAAALAWMGFEARSAILETLDQAIADDQAEVRVIAYDFNLPEILDRLEKLGSRVKVIIDNSKDHGEPTSAEAQAEARLVTSAGRTNVLRQHMGSLQHNKTIAVNGKTVKKVVFGSTNLSWRGFYVQANNALVVTGQTPVDLAFAAFDNYFKPAQGNPPKNNDVAGFGAKPSADWNDLRLPGIDAKATFSPHSAGNAKLEEIATDIEKNTTSSLLYSLAFLFETPGAVHDAIAAVTANNNIFVYGISDKKVGGLDVQDPNGNVAPVFAAELGKDVPEPFKSEPTGGTGTRMHHKFTVIDFDKPTARVYLGSYNFSEPADRKNGENLLIIRDRRIAVSYMIEALSLFDHYSFRVAQKTAAEKGQKLHLARPPRAAGEKPWWDDDFTVARKIKDRLLFA